MISQRALSTVSARKCAKHAAKVTHKIVCIRGGQLELSMCTSGRTLETLGKSYELCGNGADGSDWRDKPLWLGHASARRLDFHASTWNARVNQ
jgi:hypothetical protein